MPEVEILNYIYHNLPQATIPVSSNSDGKPRLLIKLIATLYKYRGKINGNNWYTYGQEIEIWDNWVDGLVIDLTQNFLGGHYDGSGPWEFVLFPTKYNDPLPAFIIAEMERKGYITIRPTDEMGNHLHYRPAPVGLSTAMLWWKTWTNLFTLTILYIRMLSAHGSALREKWSDWARFSTYYLFEDKVPQTSKDIKEIVERLKNYYGRSYEHITLNRNRKKTLTIEIRMCEAHPLKAWAFIYLITEITRQEKYPLFLVKDYQRLENYYYDLAEGNITDHDKVEWDKIGLKPMKTIHDNMPLRRILINMYRTYIKLEPKTPQSWLARKILEYVYEEGDIVTKDDVEEFYKYLRLKKREETLANILARAAKNI